MTIRGTSNQSIKTVSRELKDSTWELGPNAAGGGAGTPSDGAVEYRELDNPDSGSGTYFVPSEKHLPDGTTQVTTVV